MSEKIPVSQPLFSKNTEKYLTDCIRSGWVSSIGYYVSRFEQAFAKFVGTRYALATNSGTSALHLALAAVGVGPEDEVIVPALTMIASVLPIIYQGAVPILVDSEPKTGNIDVNLMRSKISRKTKAIVVVHLHGHPVEMDKVVALAKERRIFVIEDAAEAHGAQYLRKNKKWQKVGSIGDIGCFSFYGNKIITTGEGGMLVTSNRAIAEKAASLRNLARSRNRHFLHTDLGFAYRMSNLQAAVGFAQLENVDFAIKRKREVARIYNKLLGLITYLELPIEEPHARSVFWQYGILIKKNSLISRDHLEEILKSKGVETRRFFVPMHQQPVFLKMGLFRGEKYPVAEDMSERGLCLPAGVAIKDFQIEYVCKVIKNIFLKADNPT